MNTYLFLQTSRKGPPILNVVVMAETVEQAIERAHYFPYDMGEDFMDENNLPLKTEQEKIDTVHAYYGLIKDEDPWNCGNGPDGYGTVLIELLEDSKEGRLYGNVPFDNTPTPLTI